MNRITLIVYTAIIAFVTASATPNDIKRNYNVQKLAIKRSLEEESLPPFESVGLNQDSLMVSSEVAILREIERAISAVTTTECRKHLNQTLNGVRNREEWAVAMYDSSVKLPAGIEFGTTYHFGNYDQCMAIKTSKSLDRDNNVEIQSKYCLADVVVDGFRVRSQNTRRPEVSNSTLVHWGICMPISCSSHDIEMFLSSATGYRNVSVTHDKCTIRNAQRSAGTTGDLIFLSVIISFVLIIIASTIYHAYMMYLPDPIKVRSRGCFEMIIKSFSIVENLHKMGKKSSDDLGMSCINGIKAISMLFIIGSHSLVFMVGGPVLNSEFVVNESKQLRNAILLNSPLLVDSFLLLSGFLFARLLLLELDKRKGQVNFVVLYIFRYIRLTPAYMAMIGLYITWMPKMGDGPMWNQRIGAEVARCEASWWKNILYINNYVGTDQLCMFQSWYLAADTQLFILAPLILYPLWRWRKFGKSLMIAVTTISVLIPVACTYFGKLDATLLVFPDESVDLSSNEYFKTTYVKTHMRATAYFFGLITGYLVYIMQKSDYSFTKITNTLLWMLSIVVGLASMLSIVIFYDTTIETTPLINALYAGLHRLGWSFTAGWIVLACVTGHAGPISSILSARPLAALSRLTYCAYLTNGLVELYQAGTIRAPRYMSVMNLLGECLSHACLTFLAALILCLMFESPIHGVEKILLRRDSKKHKKTNTPSTSEESA